MGAPQTLSSDTLVLVSTVLIQPVLLLYFHEQYDTIQNGHRFPIIRPPAFFEKAVEKLPLVASRVCGL